MPRIPKTTDAQSRFLRAFRTRPEGPPSALWPSQAILKRWLSQPAFRKHFNSILQTQRLRSTFILSSAAVHASHHLSLSPEASPPGPTHKLLFDFLKLHLSNA